MRIKAGEILLGVRGLREVTPELLSAIHLADNVNDCLSESSFLNAWMALAIYFGQYGEVLEMASRQRKLIEEFRLDFVLPHLHLREAAAYRGRRRFRDSRAALDRADAAAGNAADSGLMSSLKIARAHVELQQARPLLALQSLERQPPPSLSPSWKGEYLASRALAFAVAGDADAALQAAESADESTIAVEARGLSAFARAIVECQAVASRETEATRHAYTQAVRESQRGWPCIRVSRLSAPPETNLAIDPSRPSSCSKRSNERETHRSPARPRFQSPPSPRPEAGFLPGRRRS